jgi:prolyl-tRNA synthetase
MALPLLRGRKTENEKFAGALRTYAIEAMMQDGRALQAGTSHNLGQNFARAFEITYQTPDNRQEYAWTTSWGVSTRLVGALIMAHSDDEGLVIPPRLAPIQVVVVPIYKEDSERARVLETIDRLLREWGDRFRVKLDDRDHLTAGFKFNEWELKGVPVRVEVGPRDVANGTAAIARRDVPGREGKAFVSQAALADQIAGLLDTIQQNLFDRALRFREEHTQDVSTYDELKEAVETGFARAYWAGTTEEEKRIQDETRATIRLVPFDQRGAAGRCVYSGRETDQQVIFARAY